MGTPGKYSGYKKIADLQTVRVNNRISTKCMDLEEWGIFLSLKVHGVDHEYTGEVQRVHQELWTYTRTE